MDYVRIGSSGLKVSRIALGAISATAMKLTDDEVRILEAPYRPHSILGHS